ncbi:TetR/AcrR family transcriptional regulator [Blastococcus sp. CT_GayMR16]|uniref:TetR/AcrR family transcriptional regulator n=1 Tax=Blastococcus sp. CT_GayMR16 TaxID=2559607 RepID=UPI001ADDCAC7|nr:TetR/AcrR family transcriptional regulator [Blastococcus sp. CT_GayMR16]
MAEDVKSRRRYSSAVRAEQAAATRLAVLGAARELFTQHGYAATSIAAIAQRAGVAVDTVYAAAGRKPALLRELVETSLSGSDQTVPAEQRDYVVRVRAASSAREKIAIYAAAVAEIGVRMAPVHRALAEASVADADCAALRAEISTRRADNMRLFAADLRATGELRGDLPDDEVADIVWSMNAAEYRALLVGERGWSAERFGSWLADAWTRLLLEG